jgi:hypothetical protein
MAKRKKKVAAVSKFWDSPWPLIIGLTVIFGGAGAYFIS